MDRPAHIATHGLSLDLARLGAPDLVLTAYDTTERLFETVRCSGESIDSVVLGPQTLEPLRTAQAVHYFDRSQELIILCRAEERVQLERRIAFSPYASENVHCWSLDEPSALQRRLVQATSRSRLRREGQLGDGPIVTSAFALHFEDGAGRLLDHLLDQIPLGVVLLDEHGRVKAYNRAMSVLLQHHPAATSPLLFSEAELEQVLAELRAVPTGTVTRIIRIGSHGERLQVRASTITDPELRIRTVLLVEDPAGADSEGSTVSNAAQKMMQAQRLEALGLLAGGVAHDFNNFLTSILGNAQIAQTDLPVNSVAYRSLKDLESAAMKAAALTHQLLAYSGRATLQLRGLELNALIRDLGPLISSMTSKKTELEFRLASGAVWVRGDASQVNQILMNLMLNASESLDGDAGKVSISTRFAPSNEVEHAILRPEDPGVGFAAVEVRDTGCGLDEATLARIFEPFFTTKLRGRGLGLAAVQGIIRGHGGGLHVSSRAGEGSCFILYLPTYVPAEDTVQKSAKLDEACGLSRLILVVDDETLVRSLAQRVLERAGYRVLLADDGEEALRKYAEHADQIDLVLLDLSMPKLDGIQVLEQLRATYPNVRVVLSSGYAERDISSQVSSSAFLGFAKKPYSPTELLRCIGRAFEA